MILTHELGRKRLLIMQPYDYEVGGTFHATILRSRLTWRTCYPQPCRLDGRYGEPQPCSTTISSGLLQAAPTNSQDLSWISLAAIGLDQKDHDIRFVEDDWEALGAWGLGWEVWLAASSSVHVLPAR